MILFHYVVYYKAFWFSNIISSCILHSVKQQFTVSYRYCLLYMVQSLFIWLKKIKVENHLINMTTKFKWRKYFLIRGDIMSFPPVIRRSDMSLPLADLCVSLVLPAAIVSCADSNESQHVLLIILAWFFSCGWRLYVALIKYQPNTLLYYCFQRKLFHRKYIEKQLHLRNAVSALY